MYDIFISSFFYLPHLHLLRIWKYGLYKGKMIKFNRMKMVRVQNYLTTKTNNTTQKLWEKIKMQTSQKKNSHSPLEVDVLELPHHYFLVRYRTKIQR